MSVLNTILNKSLTADHSLVFLCVVLLTLSTYGQQSGSISGTVTDKQSGEDLPGATILIGGTELGTTTDLNGNFRISGIPGDNVQVIASFVGYETLSIEHSLKDNPKLRIRLLPAATELEQIRVEAESEGQVKAFIRQKEANNIKNIVSAEQIDKFPDMNAAEAMQRIPGITLQRDQGEGRFVQLRGTPPELTNFNINGEQVPSPEGGVRYVGMDVIAADQIDFIEITKMLTPDMDGDAIAGTVNIITKRAQSHTPEINATIAGGYSNLRGTGNYNLQFSYGQRYNKFGLFINASYFENHYGSDNLEFKYVKSSIWTNQGEEEDNYVVRYREFQLRHYDIIRKRTGISATLDYEFNENSYIYLKGMFNSFSDDEVRRRKVYDLDDPLTENYFLYGGIEHDIKDRVKLQGLNSVNLGGRHAMNIVKINYDISYAVADENTPNRIFGRYENPGQALAIKFDYSDPDYPKPYFPKEEDEAVAMNYKEYEFDRFSIKSSTVSDRNLSARMDFQVDYLKNQDNRGFVKFGGRARYKVKEQDVHAMVLGAYDTVNPLYPGVAPPMSLPSVNDGFRDDNLLDADYVLEYIPFSEYMDQHYEFYPWFFIMSRDNLREETIMQDYYAEENIYAGYFMIQHEFRKIMILTGLRFEKTDVYYEGRQAIYHPITNKFIDADTIPASRNEEFLLPYLQFRYNLTQNFNIRAGITKSFSRPSFEDIIPTYEGAEDGDISIGNPNIKFPESVNIDFAVERYIQGDGIVSGALFYKNIENFIAQYSTFAHFDSSGSHKGFINIPINGIEAYVYGAEVQTQFKFRFLPGILKDFGFYGNYSYTHSDATIPKRKPANYSDFVLDPSLPYEEQFSEEGTENITLPGQAKHAANVAVFFDSRKLYAKLSFNYHDTFLYELGADSDLDVYYNEALHMDFTGYFRVNDHMRISLDLVNLTNQPLVYYLSQPDQIKKKEFYSWTARLGIKFSF